MEKRTGPVYLSARVQAGSGSVPSDPEHAALAQALKRAARLMLPFYRTVASGERFARKWTAAAAAGDTARLKRLLREAAPGLRTVEPSAESSGYTLLIGGTRTEGGHANGTAVSAGSGPLEPQAHRAVAQAVLPLYRSLAADRVFAGKLARAVREGNAEDAAGFIRSRVRTAALQSVSIGPGGLGLRFRVGADKVHCRHTLLQALPAAQG